MSKVIVSYDQVFFTTGPNVVVRFKVSDICHIGVLLDVVPGAILWTYAREQGCSSAVRAHHH